MTTRAVLERMALPVALLAAWEIAARTALLPGYLPAPSVIAAAFGELVLSGDLGLNLLTSLYRVTVGFALGAGTGILIGLAAGSNASLRIFFDPLVSFLYPIPKIAFLPVIFIVFGLGHGSQIAIIAFSVFFPVFLSARLAVRSIDRLYLWTARNMGADRLTVFMRVVVPAATPQLFSGLRIGLAHSFVLLFAAELIGARSGLGYLIVQGEEAVRFDQMMVGIVTFGIIGFIADRALMAVRQRVLRGQVLGTQEDVPLSR